MASSAQYSVGASAQVIAAAPAEAGDNAGPAGWVYLSNGSGGSIYLGGPNVSSANGASVAASATWTGFLFPGDQLYAVQNSGASTVGVLTTGV